MELVERYWAGRKQHAYAWRSILEANARLVFGSDAPVESPAAALGLHAAMTRERPGHPGSFAPEQRIGLDQALSAYTEGPARLSGAWPRLGNLAPGAYADLVIWDRDLHRTDARHLWNAAPLITFLEGEMVYRQGASPDAKHEPVRDTPVLAARQGPA